MPEHGEGTLSQRLSALAGRCKAPRVQRRGDIELLEARVSVTEGLAAFWLPGFVGALRERAPAATLSLTATMRLPILGREDVDFAISLCRPDRDRATVTERLGFLHVIAYAAAG